MDYCNTARRPGRQTIQYETDRLQRILNAASSATRSGYILTSLTGVYIVCTAQRSALARRSRAYQLQVERHCASLLAGESSEVPGRLLQTSFWSRRPSTTTLSQSTPPLILCHRVTSGARSGASGSYFGRRSYFVRLSVTQHWDLTVLERNYLNRGIICELLNILNTAEMLHDSALLSSLFWFTNAWLWIFILWPVHDYSLTTVIV